MIDRYEDINDNQIDRAIFYIISTFLVFITSKA